MKFNPLSSALALAGLLVLVSGCGENRNEKLIQAFAPVQAKKLWSSGCIPENPGYAVYTLSASRTGESLNGGYTETISLYDFEKCEADGPLTSMTVQKGTFAITDGNAGSVTLALSNTKHRKDTEAEKELAPESVAITLSAVDSGRLKARNRDYRSQ